MKLQKSVKPNTCILTAFAIAMDIDAAEMMREIGEDPHEKMWPQFDEPYCFRGYHIQEIIDYAVEHGFAITEIQAMPRFGKLGVSETKKLFDPVWAMTRIDDYVYGFNTVITSPTHAVACDGSKIYDPRGKIYSIVDHEDQIQSIYLVTKYT